jgi:hypothetical protein
MRVERLPFTVYDIIGYLAPGLLLLWALLTISAGHSAGNLVDFAERVLRLESEPSAANGHTGFLESTTTLILLVLGAYLTGHLLAFVSAETIERLMVALLGYPSEFLLPETDASVPYNSRQVIKKRIIASFKTPSLWLPLLLLFPYVLLVIGLNWRTSFLKKLLKRLPPAISQKVDENLVDRCDFDRRDPANASEAWFLLVEHYASNNYPGVASKMYNYVVIYGFLRNTSLALYIVAWMYTLNVTIGSPWCRDFIDLWGTTQLLIAGISLLSALGLFLAFVKFYRRYSKEAILAFVTVNESLIRRE